MLSRRRVAAIIVVLLAGGGGAALWWARSAASSPDYSEATSRPPADPVERLTRLEQSLRAVADGERNAPRDRWDPAYVVDQVGRDPDSLRAWVRENTDWIPYRGVLRGAAGVLMDRQGNSLDRAILLAALLRHAGHTSRLAAGRLPDEVVVTLLPSLLPRTVRQYDGSSDESDEWVLRAAAMEYGFDPGSLDASLAAQVGAMDSLTVVLHRRVAEQTRRLLAEVAPPPVRDDSLKRADWAAESLHDHWWVQVEQDGAWRDLELLDLPSSTPVQLAEPAALPDTLHHTLTVRVVAEQQERGGRSEQPVLSHTLRPSGLGGRSLALQLWPASWPKELHSDPQSALGLRGQALAQRQWVASLGVGDSMVASGTIGRARRAQTPSGNPMGGLGGAIAAAVANDTATAEVTAAWIEYEVRAPGRAVRSWRRAVFDLIGPAARAAGAAAPVPFTEPQRLQRSLALMMRTEMLPVTSAVAPEFGLHLVAQNLLANGDLLRTLAGADGGDLSERESFLGRFAPSVSPLYALALARLDWSRVARWLYVDQIGLLTRHRHLGAAGDGFTIRGAVEIIARDFGVAPGGPDAFTARLEQGVFDTNAEALWWGGEGINNTADAFERGRDWVLLASSNPAAVEDLRVHDDARARMREDLSTGLTLVVPREPVSRGGDHFIGWWRIDPVTGAATGTPANGWAQCGTEYSVHLTIAAQMARAMLFEYAFCHLMAQAVNEFKGFVKSFGSLLYAGPIEVLRPLDMAAGVNQGCIKGAIAAGMFATLPFLIIQSRRYAEFGLLPPGVPGPPKPFLQQGPNNTIRIPRPGMATGPYQPARGPFAPTEPGIPPTQRGMPPTQRGVPPTEPGLPPTQRGMPPTQRGVQPSQPGATPGPAKPQPRAYPPTAEGERLAREAYRDAIQRDRDAWNALNAYRDRYPTSGRWGWKYDHPGFNPQEDDRLIAAMNKAYLERQQAQADLDLVTKAIKGPSPAAASVPVPAPARIVTGASHSAQSFWDRPWD